MEITRNNLLSLIKSGMERLSIKVLPLERLAGVPKDTIRDFMRGKTQILRADKLQKILAVLQPSQRVAVVGIAGKGGLIEPEARDKNAKPDEVDCPPGVEPHEVMAVRIRGEALAPVLQDGWVVYYTGNRDAVIPPIPGGWQVPYGKPAKKKPAKAAAKPTKEASLSPLFGKPCVIGLKDGRTMLRTLKQGSKAKRYHLISYNAPDIKDAEVDWAAKIIFIRTE